MLYLGMDNSETGAVRVGYPDCCFSVGSSWFRYRAGAIIIEENALLVVTNRTVPYYYSVGGGIHMNERAEECVLREVKEETGVPYEIERLAVICENLFKGKGGQLGDLDCQVVELYFLMKSRGRRKAKCESYAWNGEKEEIRWIPIDELPGTDVRPDFLRTRVKEIRDGSGIIHIVNDERQPPPGQPGPELA